MSINRLSCGCLTCLLWIVLHVFSLRCYSIGKHNSTIAAHSHWSNTLPTQLISGEKNTQYHTILSLVSSGTFVRLVTMPLGLLLPVASFFRSGMFSLLVMFRIVWHHRHSLSLSLSLDISHFGSKATHYHKLRWTARTWIRTESHIICLLSLSLYIYIADLFAVMQHGNDNKTQGHHLSTHTQTAHWYTDTLCFILVAK